MGNITIKMNDTIRYALRAYVKAEHEQLVRYTCDDPTGFWGEDVERAMQSATTELHRAIGAQVPGRHINTDVNATVQGFLSQVEKTGIAYQLQVVVHDGDT